LFDVRDTSHLKALVTTLRLKRAEISRLTDEAICEE
jgi:hypothetical protein